MNESSIVTVPIPLTGLQKVRKRLGNLFSSDKGDFVIDPLLPSAEQLLELSDEDTAAAELGGTPSKVAQRLAAASSASSTLRQGSSDGVSVDGETEALLVPDPSTVRTSPRKETHVYTSLSEKLSPRAVAGELADTAVKATVLNPVFAKIAAFFLWLGAALKNAWSAFREHAKANSEKHNEVAAGYARAGFTMCR